ncbi:hypothetical protein C4N9_06230 [Pararhodobacter marinus]|uniref:Uncharacterized protein n=1 Tax=Pararhodobacter marinus TaxID=2184063 RepID=A0A2U2CF67_9RHOB|nr:hypothetical protein [Pararhodobacter marinus]PWE30424.1 hypothetical protein C4N9_06230 [Pararhodobacter marinus]
MLRTHTPFQSIDAHHAAVCAHFATHGEALRNAAGLLQAGSGEARVVRIMTELRNSAKLDRAMRRRLLDLHRLIALDSDFGDPETDAGLWLLPDPDSAEVQEICLLADRLYDLLVTIGEFDDETDGSSFAVEDRHAA